MNELVLNFPAKPVFDPRHIAVLVPTRRRPAMLSELIASLEITTRDKAACSLWLGIDEDDGVMAEFRRTFDPGSFEMAIH